MGLGTRNRGFRSWAVALAVGLTVSGTMVGTALAQSSSGGGGKSVFIYGDTSEPSSLNPLKGYLGTDYTIWAMEYNLPIEFAAKDFSPDYQHSIVTSVDPSSDGMSFTYHMRDGLKWSDGQPFTANDVAWTLNYYKTSNISNYSADLKLVDNVEATDDTTFVIHTTDPTSVYSGQTVYMYDYILPEHIWSKLDDPKKFPDDADAVGSGPYVVKSYTQGDNVTLVRNPNYWGTAVGLNPNVDEIIYKIYNDENQEAAALQQGELDFGYFDSANILNSLNGKANIATHGAQIPLFDEIAFNTGSAFQHDPAGGFVPHGTGSHAVADPAFRRAIAEAIDKQTLVDKVYGGYATVADSPVQPTATTGNWDPPADEALPFDLAKAKSDLAAAGYQDTDGDGIVNDPQTGENVNLVYYARSSDQNTIKTAPFVKDWLGQIGVGIKVNAVSNGKLTSIIEAGNYDMFEWGWYPNPDPNYILGIFTCEQRAPKPGVYGNNDSFYCNPSYDKLYQQQQTVTDPQQRVDIVQRMQEMLWQDQPYIVVAYTDQLEGYRTDRFTGFVTQPEKVGDLLATWGPLAFISIHPVTATSGETKGSSGVSAGIWIGIVVALIVVIGGIMLARRRSGADEDRA